MSPTRFGAGAGETAPGRADQGALRESNMALVVKTVLAAAEGTSMSRAAVAGSTAMTRSTVSRLVDELVAGGVLMELEPPTGVGPGRPAKPLVAGTGLAGLGLQVNASFLAATVVDLGGRVVASSVRIGDYVRSKPEPTMKQLNELGRSVLGQVPADVRIVGAGLALPGIVTSRSGELMLAPNLGWSEINIDSLVNVREASPEGPSSLSLQVGNEANFAALTVAQSAPGRAGPLSNFIYLSGEIGIGGALVMGGRVMGGNHGWAGELGHVCVDPHGPACPCGSTGCLERYAGRVPLIQAAGLSERSTPELLAELARSGEVAARHAIARAAWALGIALAGVINVVDVQAVVLGGHLAQIGDLLRPDLEAALASRVLSARWDRPSVRTSDGAAAPGATGAAMAQLSAVVERPADWVGQVA
jgi:predicted NBD/HSP70 family sugar kinase